MKLLITGGLGFIGSNFIQHIFKNTDWEVTNIDARFFGSSYHNLQTVSDSKNYTFVKGNITNRKLMDDLISKCDCFRKKFSETKIPTFINSSIFKPIYNFF